VPDGILKFIPPDKAPPNPRYDRELKGRVFYPKFVVFEAKDTTNPLGDPNDKEEIKRRARNALRKCIDGKQMSTKWVEKDRIPNALMRGGMNESDAVKKYKQIQRVGYARWIFMCFPGGTPSTKLYVLLDVDLAIPEIDSKPTTPSIQPVSY
jgi:hypothetical protein